MMQRKYFLRTPINVAKLSRLIAKAIDFFIILLLSIFFYPLGIVLSIIYLVVADSLQNGQSVGKKIIGLSVISLEDGAPCSVKQSTVRNLPFIVPLGLAILPPIGWILCVLVGVPLVVLELYLIAKLDTGHRLGDVMADTTVMANDGTQVQIKKRKTSWFDDQTRQVPL